MSRKVDKTQAVRRSRNWLRRKLRRAGRMSYDWVARALRFEHDGRLDFKAQYEPNE